MCYPLFLKNHVFCLNINFHSLKNDLDEIFSVVREEVNKDKNKEIEWLGETKKEKVNFGLLAVETNCPGMSICNVWKPTDYQNE